MTASSRPGERATSFAVACSLLSRFVRQNGAAPAQLGLRIKGELRNQAAAPARPALLSVEIWILLGEVEQQRTPTTINLLPEADGEETERRKQTMELFPQSAGFGVKDPAAAPREHLIMDFDKVDPYVHQLKGSSTRPNDCGSALFINSLSRRDVHLQQQLIDISGHGT
ncbi:Protein TIFY 10b [Zea mays]|uniref:Protein TIFY 10b n=1 Tax=Zea mays TaxID=4577 RepID=A0A3L6D7D9_MAIZE|nr:Protein TIFY 10b [Zea mays]